MTRSIRRSTRTRRVRRGRSAPAPPRPNRRRPLRRYGVGRASSARRSICRRCARTGRCLAAAAAGQSERDRRHARRHAGGVAAAQRHAEGRIRSRLRLCAAQGLCAGGGDVPRFPAEVSERPADAGSAILARRKSVPDEQQYRDAAEAFLAVSTKYDTTRARRRTRCCGSASRSPPWARRKRLALRSARCCANIRAPRSSVKQSVDREQKRVHC